MGVKARLSHVDITNIFENRFGNEIANTDLFEKVKSLTDLFLPVIEEYAVIWDSLYLPLRFCGRTISWPLEIREFKEYGELCIFTGERELTVKQGDEKADEDYFTLIDEVLDLARLVKSEGTKVLNVPYNIRTGKIKAKHVVKSLTSDQAVELEKSYRKHELETSESPGTYLTEYLRTAAIIYRAWHEKKTEGLSPRQMYTRWADGRDVGMLSIRHNSREAFREWNANQRGGHPFEIMGYKNLNPPNDYFPYYHFSLGSMPEPQRYARVVMDLIRASVPFRIHGFEEVLQWLTGETEVNVNDDEIPRIYYRANREDYRRYFHHIKWDPLKLPNWK